MQNLNPSKLSAGLTSEANQPSDGKQVNTSFVYIFLIVISIGTFQFGYSISVFNTLQVPFCGIFGWYDFTVGEVPDFTNASNRETILTAICTLGSAFGALFSGPFAKLGKLRCIFLTNFIVIVGCGLTLIQNEYIIMAGRFIYGISTGSFSVFVPLYINETAPIEIKGSVGVMT